MEVVGFKDGLEVVGDLVGLKLGDTVGLEVVGE